MKLSRRTALVLPVLLAILAGCGSQGPSGKAAKEIGDAEKAIANAKAYADKSELEKAAMEYNRASTLIAQGKALAVNTEVPSLQKLDAEAQSGAAAVQKQKEEKEKAAEEARKKEELAQKTKRWRTRVAIPAEMDYLNVLPANMVIAGQLKNLGQSIENARKTALGRLLAAQDLAPLWKKLQAELNDKQEFSKNLDLWLPRFKGEFAFALWQLDFQDASGMRVAAVAEITDPVPEAVLDELLEKTEFFPPAGPFTVTYKDVDIWQPAPGGPAVALLGRHLVLGPNADSVKAIVDGFLKPGGFGASANCATLKPSLAQKPEVLVFMDLQGYLSEVNKMMGALPGKDTKAAVQKMMDAANTNIKLVGMSSTCVGDGFEDRSAAISEGELKGFGSMMAMPAGTPPPLNALAFVPANAAVAQVGYMNAQVASTALRAYLAGFDQMVDSVAKEMPPPPAGAPAPPHPLRALKAFEEKTGINLDELLAGLKGECGFYVVLAPGLVTQPPDIGMFITCAAPEKAKAFSDAIAKGLGAYFSPSPVRELPVQGRTLYQLDLQALGLPVEQKFPYTPCWAVEGSHIFLASSPQALRKQLSYVDSKADAGLLTQPDFVKALSGLAAEERKSQIVYMDMKNLLAAAAMLGLPLLQARITDPELKSILQGLPQPQVLFKDITPLVGGGVQRPGRVESVLRSPVPPVGTVAALGIGLALFIVPHIAERP
ncbi:MAG: hypothetical protein ABSE73_24870, partial [Planctomycetota bacterium]